MVGRCSRPSRPARTGLEPVTRDDVVDPDRVNPDRSVCRRDPYKSLGDVGTGVALLSPMVPPRARERQRLSLRGRSIAFVTASSMVTPAFSTGKDAAMASLPDQAAVAIRLRGLRHGGDLWLVLESRQPFEPAG